MVATKQQLVAKNKELSEQLERTEASLRGILSGAADALFVSGAAGANVFAVKGADQAYRTLIENMGEGALTLSRDGLVLYANRCFAKMLRMPLEKVIGSDVFNWFAPDSRQVVQTLLLKDMPGKHSRELVLAARDGTQVPVYLSLNRLVLDGIDHVCMVVADLTEQKRNEAILVEEKLEHAILEQAADAIIICDRNGCIIRASKQAQIYNDLDLIGQQFTTAFPLRRPDGTAVSPNKKTNATSCKSLEARLEHNARGFDLLVSIGHLKGARDDLLGSVVTLTDISERKVAEDRIRRLNRVYVVLSNINTLIMHVRDCNELYNEACCIAVEDGGFRMSMIATVDQSAMQILPVASAGMDEKLLPVMKKMLSSGLNAPNSMVARAIREKKAIVSNNSHSDPQTLFTRPYIDAGICSIAIFPLIFDDAVLGVFALYSTEAEFFDVEELKLLAELAGEIAFAIYHIREQAMNTELEFATSVAEKANIAKSEFLFNMSHELRSPLHAILGFAQLMEIDSPPPTPGQQESISQILEAGWHLLALINEVLDLAKIESGEVPIECEPVSLATVMLECRGMIEPQSRRHGIPVTFPPPGLSYYVQADRIRVKQVLINLLSNAIKYNREQGTVEVTCTESTVGRVRVSVKDTGVGLSPADQEQLFQRFNRLGKDAGNEEGTGIGLVLCKRLIELMDGSIGLESHVGAGSVFWFELNSGSEPHLSITDDQAVVTGQLPQVQQMARPCTLLYLEDNIADMKLLKKIIGRYPDIQLLSAANGTLGIELAHKHQPDIIMTEIDLPGISGFDVLKSLHSDPVTAHIPIIVLSADAMPRDVKRGMQAGFFRYLTKPTRIDEFMDALGMALNFIDEQANMKNKVSK